MATFCVYTLPLANFGANTGVSEKSSLNITKSLKIGLIKRNICPKQIFRTYIFFDPFGIYLIYIIRGGPRAAATSKMEHFVAIVNGFNT